MTRSITLITVLTALSGCDWGDSLPASIDDAAGTYTLQTVGELQARDVSGDMPDNMLEVPGDGVMLQIVDLEGAQISVLD